MRAASTGEESLTSTMQNNSLELNNQTTVNPNMSFLLSQGGIEEIINNDSVVNSRNFENNEVTNTEIKSEQPRVLQRNNINIPTSYFINSPNVRVDIENGTTIISSNNQLSSSSCSSLEGEAPDANPRARASRPKNPKYMKVIANVVHIYNH